MSRSIYWKITIPFAVLILVGMGILGLYTVTSVRDIQLEHVRSQLLRESQVVARGSIGAFSDPAKRATLDAEAKATGEEIQARITFIALDGTVLGDTDDDPATMENHSTRPEVIQALASGVGESTRFSATLNQSMMYVAVPVSSGGTVLGIARVSLPLTEVESSVGDAQRTIAAVLAVAALLTIVAAGLIARMITRPVRQMTAAAQTLASGKLDHRIDLKSDDEIGRLGNAFNEMATSLKHTLAVISDERSKLAAVLSGITDGVIMTDLEGRIVLVNAAAERILAINEAGVKGLPLIEGVHDYEVEEVLKKCLGTGREQTGELDASGGRFLRVIAVPLTGSKLSGALLIFQDLTEMRGLQTMRREFVGNVSHELRTPLAAIKAIVETLQDGAMDDKAVAGDFLEKIDAEVDGMTEMVAELIELSRIETGRVKLVLLETDLNQLANEAVSHLSHQAERKKLVVSTELASGLPPVQADRGRIRQVLVNLIHNAIKFTPAGGNITISTKQRGDSVVAEVADTGIGISREDLPRIFERFFKADRSRSTGGTGLGLAIAKHTIQAHGGNIRARSEEGKGSTFSFSLPLRQS